MTDGQKPTYGNFSNDAAVSAIAVLDFVFLTPLPTYGKPGTLRFADQTPAADTPFQELIGVWQVKKSTRRALAPLVTLEMGVLSKKPEHKRWPALIWQPMSNVLDDLQPYAERHRGKLYPYSELSFSTLWELLTRSLRGLELHCQGFVFPFHPVEEDFNGRQDFLIIGLALKNELTSGFQYDWYAELQVRGPRLVQYYLNKNPHMYD